VSKTILEFARSFINGRLTADQFADSFQELWKIERDNKTLLDDNENLSECLSSIFCASDAYNPELDRESYEFDEEQLKKEVKELINKLERRQKQTGPG
jgi:hypothetical protein